MGIFNNGNNSGGKDKSRSIVETIRHNKKKTMDEVKAEITKGIIEVDAQKELYRVTAQRAIQKAKRAIANRNDREKAIAYQELKFAYGIYHYMDTLHTAFRTIESQLHMQEMTQSFAKVVNTLKGIHVPAGTMDFNKLTAIALRSLDVADIRGLEEMVEKLIHGSMDATNSVNASDSFLDDLVNGTATLEPPYPSQTNSQEQAVSQKQEENMESTDLTALLDQINAGLKG